MLTLIAYRFSVDAGVPRVGYMTRMDCFVLGSSVLVFLALCQVVLTARLADPVSSHERR
jgi:gamma-aminobutyric acid receptor subunit beta